MKIVVTGGAGMIGSNLCAELLRGGHEVVVLDNLWRGSIDNLIYTCGDLYEKLTFVNADLSVLGDWIDSLKDSDCVYHLADIVAGIGYVFSNESQIFRKNLLINSNVATACEIMSVKRYVYVGTACSFPLQLQTGVDARPLKESDQFPANPESAYGWSKLMGELDAGYIQKYSKIPSVILVLHNVYGTPCDYKSNRSQVLPSLAYKALSAYKNNDCLNVWGDGSQGRAFVHVSDVVNALLLSLKSGHGEGPIQIGPDICTSIKESANVIIDILDKNIKVEFDLSKPTGDKGRCADYSKALQLLGWRPNVKLREGLIEMLHWIRQKEKI